MSMEKELLSESEIIGALTACNNRKGNRCSQCPIFGRGWYGLCIRILDREAIKLIEKQQVEIDKLKIETVEALEKQIPQKVKKVRHETILGYAVTVRCPFCGGSVWQNADESKYCFRCGQAIDWEAKL